MKEVTFNEIHACVCYDLQNACFIIQAFFAHASIDLYAINIS